MSDPKKEEIIDSRSNHTADLINTLELDKAYILCGTVRGFHVFRGLLEVFLSEGHTISITDTPENRQLLLEDLEDSIKF